MTSPVPGIVAWPLILFVIAVTVGRWLVVNDTVVDGLINRALVVAIAGNLLREARAEELGTHVLWFLDADNVMNFMRLASCGCILLTVTYVYGIAKIWAGADLGTARYRQRFYNGVAIGTILVAGTSARQHDLLTDQYLGWESIVTWAAFNIPGTAAALLVCRVSLNEMRASDVRPRERIVCLGVLGLAVALGFISVVTPLATFMEATGGSPSEDPSVVFKALAFFGATVCTSVAVSVPLISTFLTHTGWDRTGRYCRRLTLLWSDLTSATPDIVLRSEGARLDSATRLHRMIVEIRDSLLRLQPYADDNAGLDEIGGPRNPPSTSESGQYLRAVRIAQAVAVKTSGVEPTMPSTARLDLLPGTRDLTGELQQLLSLAAVWPKARATMAGRRPARSWTYRLQERSPG